MKKALGQTVRDLKRGVNKKVLKVPGLERKVLDATCNEAWGPHGSHLAEIAQASKNPAEFRMIMGVLWKRLSDTGKNWRHVYKALIVLEYLVANGSERVIDEINVHAHQISTLSEFQYVDSSGRDQGSNVRRKSQSLVFLVTDKERIQEARQKASASRDKFGKPGGYSAPGGYGDRYNEDNQTGYGNDDHYGRYGDSASRDGDRSDRESEAQFSRDDSVEDEHQGKERNRNADRDSNHRDDDGYSSSRGSGVRPDDYSHNGRNDNRRYPENNPGDPPSYEEVASEGRTFVQSERGRDTPRPASSPAASSESRSDTKHGTSEPPVTTDLDNFDEFDPRGPAPASGVPALNSNGAGVDLLGSLSDSFFPDNAAHIPNLSGTDSGGDIMMDSGSVANLPATFSGFNQPFEDPFGDTPFKATPSTESGPTQAQNPHAFQSTMNQGLEIVPAQSFAPQADALSTFDYGTPFGNASYAPSAAPNDQFSAVNTQIVPSGFHDQETDILAGILPLSGFVASPSAASLETSQASPVQSFEANDAFGGYHQQAGPVPPMASQLPDQSPSRQNAVMNNEFFSHQGFTAPSHPYMDSQLTTQPHNQPNDGDFFQQLGSSLSSSMPSSGLTEPDSHNQPDYRLPSESASWTSQMGPGFSYAPNSQQQAGNFHQQSASSVGTLFTNPQQPNSMLMAPPDIKGQNPQHYSSGYPLQNPSSTAYGSPLMAPTSTFPSNAQHSNGGIFQQPGLSVKSSSVSPHGQSEWTDANSNGFLHQKQGSNMVPGQSYTATGPSNNGNFLSSSGSSQFSPRKAGTGTAPNLNSNGLRGIVSQRGPANQVSTSQPSASASVGPLALVPQQPKDKFETKSTVWADTLSRGLVNLNISGSKTNPLADIGIDFDAINRKEKRKEKPAATPVVSTVTMGKAMGSGSGIGRSGATALRPSASPMLNPGTGPGFGLGSSTAGYGGITQQPMGGFGGMSHQHPHGGYGVMNQPQMGGFGGTGQQPMGMGFGMGMNMNMGQGSSMQQPAGFPPGSSYNGGYNPMMGNGGGGGYGGGYQ